MSVRGQLLLLTLLASLVPALVAGMQFLDRRDAEFSTARKDLAAAARQVALDLDEMARATAQLHYGLSHAQPLEAPDMAVCSAFLADALRMFPQYLSILKFAPDGELVCDSLLRGRKLNVIDRGYFQDAIKASNSIGIEPVISRLTGSAVLTIAFAARYEGDDVKHVLVSSLNLDKLTESLAQKLARGNVTLALVDGKGTVLTWHPGGEKLRGTSIADSPLFRLVHRARDEGMREAIDTGGANRIWAASTLSHFTAPGLHVLVGVAKDDLLASANRSLVQALGILLAVWVCVSAGVWILASGVMRRELAEGQRIRLLNETLEARVRVGVAQAKAEMQRAQALLEAAPDPVVIVDGDSRIRIVNARTETAFGYTRAELIGQVVQTLIPDWSRAAHPTENVAHQRDTSAQASREGRDLFARRKDGAEFVVDVSLSPLATPEGMLIISTFRDMTERRRADERIRGQLEHLSLLDHITRAVGERQDLKSIFQVVVRSLDDSMPVDLACVCLHDEASNALTVDAVGLKAAFLGHELALNAGTSIEVDGNGLARCLQGRLVYEPDLATVRFPFSERLVGGGLRSVVMVPLRAQNRVFGLLLVARRTAGAFTSVECEFLRQLSEHVALAAHQASLYESLQRAYEDLRHTQEAAMQQERLRALGQMASGIAHDINNALSPVSLYTESLLATEKDLSGRARGYLKTIQRAVEDVAETVARMREFYRHREDQVALVPVDVSELAQQVLELTKARWSDMALRRGVTIRVVPELDAKVPMIMGVASEIREALTNLVFNAVDAMPEGGTLTLRTSLDRTRPRDSVIIEVADTGIGMDDQTRKRCLEPFFTTKGERGTGLGLAMVFGMLQRHRAEIEIDSAPGNGSTMRLIFEAPTAAVPEAGDGAGLPEVPKNLRLLLADDDPVLLKSLRDALEGDGHHIFAANGGRAAIDEFRSAFVRGEVYAAVITDLGMPNVDGRNVAAAVKEVSPTTPVILLTGWGERLVAEGDIPPHVDRVLAKPPKLREVHHALVQLCGSQPRRPDPSSRPEMTT